MKKTREKWRQRLHVLLSRNSKISLSFFLSLLCSSITQLFSHNCHDKDILFSSQPKDTVKVNSTLLNDMENDLRWWWCLLFAGNERQRDSLFLLLLEERELCVSSFDLMIILMWFPFFYAKYNIYTFTLFLFLEWKELLEFFLSTSFASWMLSPSRLDSRVSNSCLTLGNSLVLTFVTSEMYINEVWTRMRWANNFSRLHSMKHTVKTHVKFYY